MKYNVGDKVRIKSLDWYNENKDKDGFVHCGDRVFDNYMSVFCGSVVTIGGVCSYGYDIIEDMHCRTWTDEMIEGLVEEETKNNNDMEEKETLLGWVKENDSLKLVPHKDYEIKHDGDNFYLVKKKKEYPKTLEECCEVLDTGGYQIDYFVKPGEVYEYEKALITKISTLYNLIICRDAYWKIAGEEMGLNRPWEPDWKNDKQGRYMIMVYENKLHKDKSIVGTNFILVFPTKEMRDAFYENFKELIESVKELL